jgi:glutamate N-acetyltransferase/amino-acid N-acetyltransferase
VTGGDLPGGFFRSRWVERPAHVTELDPTALPAGFRAGAAEAGIKPSGLDVALLVNEGPEAASAARFTRSAVVGAPVQVSRAAATERLRAVLASSGNANVADGARGLETAVAGRAQAARMLGLEPEEVGVAATGLIGRELPRKRLLEGIERAAGRLADDARELSEAIVTTDRRPKRACLDVELPSGRVRLAAQAKGAGMAAPAFATVLCFLQTDAAVDAATLDLLTGVTVARSLERATVDGQLSTSDTVFSLAGGASGVRVEPESPDELALGEAMDALMRQLAVEIVADGEGARRIGRVVVRGAAEDVEPVARAVAGSPLVKAALYGADPNFGRLLQAAGHALADGAGGGTGDGSLALDLDIEGRRVVTGGVAHDLDADALADLERAVSGDEVELVMTVPGEGGETEVLFSDLSHGYVTLNAEYMT